MYENSYGLDGLGESVSIDFISQLQTAFCVTDIVIQYIQGNIRL